MRTRNYRPAKNTVSYAAEFRDGVHEFEKRRWHLVHGRALWAVRKSVDAGSSGREATKEKIANREWHNTSRNHLALPLSKW